jgi:hypothetical protein
VEKVTLKINHGLLSVEEIFISSDRENVYVCYALLGTNGAWEVTVGLAPADDPNRVYLSVMDKEVQASVMAEALPILLNALEIKSLHPDSPEELQFYRNAIRDLALL